LLSSTIRRLILFITTDLPVYFIFEHNQVVVIVLDGRLSLFCFKNLTIIFTLIFLSLNVKSALKSYLITSDVFGKNKLRFMTITTKLYFSTLEDNVNKALSILSDACVILGVKNFFLILY